jgi:hypothetical protein
MRYFNLLFFFCFYLIGLSQPKGFESYSAIKKCDSLELGVKTMRPEVNSDSLTTRSVYSSNFELTAEGIDNVVLELERILYLHGIDFAKPTKIESSFGENIDNFDAEKIVKYLSKRTKDFVFEYRLPDNNLDAASDASWSLTYAIDNKGVRLRCEEYVPIIIYIGNK